MDENVKRIMASMDAEYKADVAREEEKTFIDKVHESLAGAMSSLIPSASPVASWFAKLPSTVTAGVVTAAVNAVDAVEDVLAWTGKVAQENKEADSPGSTQSVELLPASTFDTELKPHILAFRDYIAGSKQNKADEITQAVAQYAVPFMGWAKMFGAGKAFAIGKYGSAAAKTVAADFFTGATALEAHDQRVADLVQLGKETEGKFADVINTISPDGSLFNTYINYMTNRENESEIEGRWKNGVDNAAVSVAVMGLVKAGATTFKGARLAVENLPAKGSTTRMAPANQKGHVSLSNNASGESAASMEAISRSRQEAEAGQTRFVIDADDTVRPLTGVDAVDATAKPGQMIVQRGVGAEEWTVLDRGGTSAAQLKGRIARVQGDLDKLKEKK